MNNAMARMLLMGGVLVALLGTVACTPVPSGYPRYDELCLDFTVESTNVELRTDSGFKGCEGGYWMEVDVYGADNLDYIEIKFHTQTIGSYTMEELAAGVGGSPARIDWNYSTYVASPSYEGSYFDFTIDGAEDGYIWGTFSGRLCGNAICESSLWVQNGRYSAEHLPSSPCD